MLSVRWSERFSHFSTNSMQPRPSHSYFQHILMWKKCCTLLILVNVWMFLNGSLQIMKNEMFWCRNFLWHSDTKSSPVRLYQVGAMFLISKAGTHNLNFYPSAESWECCEKKVPNYELTFLLLFLSKGN